MIAPIVIQGYRLKQRQHPGTFRPCRYACRATRKIMIPCNARNATRRSAQFPSRDCPNSRIMQDLKKTTVNSQGPICNRASSVTNYRSATTVIIPMQRYSLQSVTPRRPSSRLYTGVTGLRCTPSMRSRTPCRVTGVTLPRIAVNAT